MGGEKAEVFTLGSNLLWLAWKCQCKWVFELSVDTVAASSMACTEGIRHYVPETSPNSSTLLAWTTPPLNASKINADASLDQNSTCVVAISRDSLGQAL